MSLAPNMKGISGTVAPNPKDKNDEIAASFADGKSFEVKDLLKNQGYKWDPKRLCWFKTIPTPEWSAEYIDSQTWNNGSLTIEVKSSTDEMIYCNY